jgi:N-methylhydantoinase A/oxoprolinase/acetone carboxylase beta subunit
LWTVDIDVGGTLTDGIFTNNENVFRVKVDTTPHDLTVCLFDCLGQAAAKLGFVDTVEFLENVELIRWSTTITSNVLAESRGPRIGLLVSKGHERDLYAPAPKSIAFHRLLAEKDVIGVNGSVSEPDIINAARSLLESGVRRICISLKDSHRDSSQELAVKSIIDRQYPDHFLGSVPVLAGCDISKSADDTTRTYSALINAYTHGALAATLFKAEDDLRQASHYSGTFLVSHINGGVAGIAKTKAIDTIESGPILGIHGSAYLAKAYGLKNVIAMDIGGTTAKISVLSNGEPIYRKPADFFGIPVEISLPHLRSIALGGGSVVKPVATSQHVSAPRQGTASAVPKGAGNSGVLTPEVGSPACEESSKAKLPPGSAPDPAVQLGPESMGSFPGPACYGLGGDQPTLTDAFVTAGLIDPDFFLGGTKPIDRDLAKKAIEDHVAGPLHLSADETCRIIIDRAFQLVADMIAAAAAELHQDLARHTLFAYGGNGGLFACGVAEKAGLANVLTFSLGPVFSAFGSSVSDILHVYERALSGAPLTDAGTSRIREVLAEMKAEGVKDLLGEGIRPDALIHSLEIEVSANHQNSRPIPFPESSLESAAKFRAALAAAGATPNEETSLELIRLRVKKPMSKPQLVERALESPDAAHAHRGARPILWGSRTGQAQIYSWESLAPGNRIEGPAILEGMQTTYFVPENWTMLIDRFGNGALSRHSQKS